VENKQLIPFKPTIEAREKIWAKLSRCDGEFVIFLIRCHVHTVEACVAVKRQEHMDEFEYFVLKAISILGCADIGKINDLLHTGRQIIQQITAKLSKNDLLSAHTDGSVEITALGKTVLDKGEMIRLEKKRHIFHFIDGNNEFVRINNQGNKFLVDLSPHETAANWNFDMESLQKCINETDDWKQQRQFPANIHELIRPRLENTVSEESGAENTIIVDKAQLINCAILVKFSNNKPSELLAYPISPTGHLLAMDNLFSLTGEESILKVFPNINEIPDNEQLLTALKTIGQKHTLGNIGNITVTGHKTHTTIETNNDNDINWARFYWQNIQGNIFCDIASASTIRMNKLHVESKSSSQRAINLLFELNKSYLSENNLKDISAYKVWLLKKPHLTDEPIRRLASLAWEFGNYRLAYNLAELEDIADAAI
jgi:predicted transcriptional regulator